MEILTKLGIDWRLLIAQIVNFAILLAVLYRFVYKPLLGLLEKREKMIEKSVEDAKAIEERLRATEKGSEEILTKACVQAAALLEQAEKTAEERTRAATEKTKEDVRQIVEQTRAMLKNEKEAMIASVRQEIAEVVIHATEQVLRDVSHEKVSEQLVKKTLESVRG
ncbi:MAG: F0F1 ATP synthase subunit B [Patescibacteria group bacterium]